MWAVLWGELEVSVNGVTVLTRLLPQTSLGYQLLIVPIHREGEVSRESVELGMPCLLSTVGGHFSLELV